MNKNFFELLYGGLDYGSLHSTRHYQNSDGLPKCIYCHNENNGGDWGTFNSIPISYLDCNCDKAKEELKIKREFMDKIGMLDESVDSGFINVFVKLAKIKEIEHDFDNFME